jgi:hypothetical protein
MGFICPEDESELLVVCAVGRFPSEWPRFHVYVPLTGAEMEGNTSTCTLHRSLLCSHSTV